VFVRGGLHWYAQCQPPHTRVDALRQSVTLVPPRRPVVRLRLHACAVQRGTVTDRSFDVANGIIYFRQQFERATQMYNLIKQKYDHANKIYDWYRPNAPGDALGRDERLLWVPLQNRRSAPRIIPLLRRNCGSSIFRQKSDRPTLVHNPVRQKYDYTRTQCKRLDT